MSEEIVVYENRLPAVLGSEWIVQNKPATGVVSLALKVPSVLRIEIINEGRYLLWDWTNVPGAKVRQLYPGDGERAYWRGDELPKVVREKMAMLRMVDRGTELEGVGRRIAETVFWIFGEGV